MKQGDCIKLLTFSVQQGQGWYYWVIFQRCKQVTQNPLNEVMIDTESEVELHKWQLYHATLPDNVHIPHPFPLQEVNTMHQTLTQVLNGQDA